MSDTVHTEGPLRLGKLAQSTADVLQAMTGGLSVAVLIVADDGKASISLRSDTTDALRMAHALANSSSAAARPDCCSTCADAHDRLRQAALLFKPEAGKC